MEVINLHRLLIVQTITNEIIRQLDNDKEIDFSKYTDPEDIEVAKLINQTVKEIKDHFENRH